MFGSSTVQNGAKETVCLHRAAYRPSIVGGPAVPEVRVEDNAAAGRSGQQDLCVKRHSFLNFSYVCPEPVLVKCSVLYTNGSKRGVFAPSGCAAVGSSIISTAERPHLCEPVLFRMHAGAQIQPLVLCPGCQQIVLMHRSGDINAIAGEYVHVQHSRST